MILTGKCDAVLVIQFKFFNQTTKFIKNTVLFNPTNSRVGQMPLLHPLKYALCCDRSLSVCVHTDIATMCRAERTWVDRNVF